MKNIIVIVSILSFFAVSTVFAGNDNEPGNAPATTAITGKVIDNVTMEELAGVSVQIEGTDMKAYTDIEGNFKIEGLQPGTYDLNIMYISYENKKLNKVNVDKTAGDEIEIKLEQK